MLAELAIANAAFQVIKNTLMNGKEIADAGASVAQYFKAEKDIAKAAASKKGNVLEAFQAKEQLARQEADLKYLLNKSRINGYTDFLAFKAQYSRDIKEAEKQAAREQYQRRKAIDENISIGLKACGIIFVIIAAAFGVALYLR